MGALFSSESVEQHIAEDPFAEWLDFMKAYQKHYHQIWSDETGKKNVVIKELLESTTDIAMWHRYRNVIDSFDTDTPIGAVSRILRHSEFDGNVLASCFATLAMESMPYTLIAMLVLQHHSTIRSKTTCANTFRHWLFDNDSIPILRRAVINAAAYNDEPNSYCEQDDFERLIHTVRAEWMYQWMKDHRTLLPDINGNHDIALALLHRVYAEPALPPREPIGHVDDMSESDTDTDADTDDENMATNDDNASYGMWKVSGMSTNIDQLVAACQPIISGTTGSDLPITMVVVWKRWAYQTTVESTGKPGEITVSVHSNDDGSCENCMTLIISRTGCYVDGNENAWVTSYLKFVNYCFGDPDHDRCFPPKITKNRARVIMRMVDLVNRICKVQYCTAKDAQEWKGNDFYPGSAHTMLKNNAMFYEKFGFILQPAEGATSLDMDGIDGVLHTHCDIKELFHEIMKRTAADAMTYLERASSRGNKRARDSDTHIEKKATYTVLLPAHASRNVSEGKWYMDAETHAPAYALHDKHFPIDTTMFDDVQMHISIRDLSVMFRGMPIFIKPHGVAAPVSLVQCELQRDVNTQRASRLQKVATNLIDNHLNDLAQIDFSRQLVLLRDVFAEFEDAELASIIGTIFQYGQIVKYYRTRDDRYVIKGISGYNVVDVDNVCLAIASAQKRVKTTNSRNRN